MVLRRLLVIVSTAVLVAVLANWWKQRTDDTVDADPPQWPPWPDTSATPAVRSAGQPPTWVEADGGEAPAGYPIKLNASSGIFHVPGGRFYERTNPDRWYATAEAAIADGYRQSKT
jgi:hypothetical protein